MRRYRQVNWSEVVRNAIKERIEREKLRSAKDWSKIMSASKSIDEHFEEIQASFGKVDFDSSQTIRFWRDRRYGPLSQTHR